MPVQPRKVMVAIDGKTNPMTVSNNTLQRLKIQRAKLDVCIQGCAARDKARQRKHDLQRKILMDTYLLEHAQQEGSYAALVAKLDG